MSQIPSPHIVTGLKRRHSDLPSSPAHALDTPIQHRAKRARVAFDQSIDVRILDQSDEKPLELVRDEVRAAIYAHSRVGEKDDTGYDALRRLFGRVAAGDRRDVVDSDSEFSAHHVPTTFQLKQYIIALMDRLSELKGCASLMAAVLDIDWFTRDESFVSTYTRFLGNLGTTLPGYLKPILERIVRLFGSLPPTPPESTYAVTIGKPQILTRLHNALRYILRLIPSASGSLAEVLAADYPNFRMTQQRAYLSYIRNLFRIPQYAPELRSDILMLVIERSVKLDVEVQQEIDLLEEDDLDEDIMGGRGGSVKYERDDGSDQEEVDSDSDSDISSLDEDSEDRRIQKLREASTKLDGAMDMLFDYYTTSFSQGTRIEHDDTFENLISLFTSFILPTYRSRHPQFLILHFAQINTRFSARFISHCLQLVIGQSITTSGSTSAAAYLASFIARAAQIPRYQIQQCVTTLLTQLNKHRALYERTSRGPDLARFPLFYAMTQALLYIFCFRWRDLMVATAPAAGSVLDDIFSPEAPTPLDAAGDYDVFTRGEPTWQPGLKDALTQAIYSSLNPLKICSPTVVNQFAAIARHLRFMYVYPLLETNKRIKLASAASAAGIYHGGGKHGQDADAAAAVVSAFDTVNRRDTALSHKAGEAHLQLEAFFPFDPYQLPRSRHWLQGDYVEWKGVPGMDTGEDDEDDDDDDDDDEVDDDDDDDDDEDDESASDDDDVESGAESA